MPAAAATQPAACQARSCAALHAFICHYLHADRQAEYCVGASVYDRSHSGSNRGYGTITEAVEPGKWRVHWSRGSRACASSEPYLELALIRNSSRVPPTAMQQPILVVLGTHMGKAGTTLKRVRAWGAATTSVAACLAACIAPPHLAHSRHPAPSRPSPSHLRQAGDAWQCRLEGEKGTITFPDDYLHATGAAAGAAVAPFEPVCLASGLALPAVHDFLAKYANDPATAIDLVLIKPDSRTWLSVLMGERAIDDLSTDEVLSLRHVAARKPWKGSRAAPQC